LSLILPRTNLAARRLASIANTCLSEILPSRKFPVCKDVLPDFAKYRLFLPHVSYRRISPSKAHRPNMDSHPATLSTVYCDCNIWRREGWIEYEVFSFWKREINQSGLREAWSVDHRRLLASCSPPARHVMSLFVGQGWHELQFSPQHCDLF
jgi:hypothetical protein